MVGLNHMRGGVHLRRGREGVNATGLQARLAIHNATDSCRKSNILNAFLFFSFVMFEDRDVATLAAPSSYLAMASLFLAAVAIRKAIAFRDG